MKCQSVTDFGNVKTVKLAAVGGKEGDNSDYSKFTPCGLMELTINPGTKAYDTFKPGSDYYLTLTESKQ